LGAKTRVVGVTPYCGRYVAGLEAPVVADYLSADPAAVRAVAPDLVLACDGVQLKLARRLAAAGLPVYVLPVPTSRFGLLENVLTVGALIGELERARDLTDRLEREAAELLAAAPAVRPRTYVELWLGRHARRPGGRTFVHDIVSLAGCQHLGAGQAEGYLPLELAVTAAARPEMVVVFSEPEHPVDAAALLRERGWDEAFSPRVVISTVARGRNLIHDGPSFLETARWLAGEVRASG
jgi:ABC-type Fe3+-hydroxamate transport system substrate-binding protein